jgi:TP53 regulating kinase-like protein
MAGIIARGAEAVLSEEGGTLLKDRVRKGYRAPELDKRLRARRTRLESSALRKAALGKVNVPRVLSVDDKTCKIEMDFLDGPTLKNRFSIDLMPAVAEQVIRLHSAGIIHGDLTTSNMIIKDGKVFLIDFGLAKFSVSAEDRAVDLHVLEEALESAHTDEARQAFGDFLSTYSKKFPEVAQRLKKVESRGRYRSR